MRQLIAASFVLTLVAVPLTAQQAPAPAPAPASPVVRWNDATLQAIRAGRVSPPVAARALAVVHTCVYDAWAAYDAHADGTVLGGSLRRPPAERAPAARAEAVSIAAYRALVDLFPAQRAAIFDPLLAELGVDATNQTTALDSPAGVANVACGAVLAARHHDGANQLGDLAPGAYSDYTGYAPANTPETIVDPSRWQPLRQADGTAQRFLLPHWGLVTTFAFPVGQVRPPAPPAYGTHDYLREAREVLHMSADLSDRDKVIAEYWADGPASVTPPGHWMLFGHAVSARDGHGLDDDVKLYFVLSSAMLDASVAVWDCKRAFDAERPVTAVRYLWAGQPIRAWGGPYHGTETIDGALFRSYIATPPFAEYVSGHSTFSAAGAAVLRALTGSDHFGGSVTIAAGSSPIEPGVVPAADLTLRWATFSAAADEAGMSRRLGGIHFRSGDLRGREMGRLVADAVLARATQLFAGAAAGPATTPPGSAGVARR
jgi:hypothetical protein